MTRGLTSDSFSMKTGENQYREVNRSQGIEIIDQVMNQVSIEGSKYQNVPKSNLGNKYDDCGNRHRLNARKEIQSRKDRNEMRKQKSMHDLFLMQLMKY